MKEAARKLIEFGMQYTGEQNENKSNYSNLAIGLHKNHGKYLCASFVKGFRICQDTVTPLPIPTIYRTNTISG
jgi:hypothetical protein